MERKLKEAFFETANQYNFPDQVNTEHVLLPKKGKSPKQLGFIIAPLCACLLLLVLFDIPQGIANLFKSEEISHTYSDYLIHNGHYYIPTQSKIDEKELDQQLGEVVRTGGYTFLQEGDTTLYIPGTKYYSILSSPESEKIAVELWGGTKLEPKIIGYQVLERKEALEEIDNSKVLGGKGDEKEVNVALANIREYVPFIHEFDSEELMPTLVKLDNDGQHYSVLTHYSSRNNGEDNSKFIFFFQYEKGFTSTHNLGDFYHNSSKILSSFSLAGVNWTQYQTNKDSYFKGEKDNVVFEISSQNYTAVEVRKFLESLELTSK
ncbi:hypothetical protein SAMN05444673_4002 [Bacillus sp. OV166]|uniref:hypothetical protein n=1 Tax=Bacillus sp. OV166 TaxID=1882763 RepID=UPI000A2AE215|nr:hypothetical protein [Bacillus sp. OV166]SMQ80846.1 hypothetical protein SAMN05444673_4002 [Bacillus sp. OV166]